MEETNKNIEKSFNKNSEQPKNKKPKFNHECLGKYKCRYFDCPLLLQEIMESHEYHMSNYKKNLQKPK